MNDPVAASSLSSILRWRIIILLMTFAGFGHFNRVAISVAGSEVFIPDLHLSEVQMGWVYTAFLIVYTIAMVPGGWLIDRIGSARALALYGLTMGTFVALTGVVGWLTGTPESLWIGLLIIRSCAGFCSAPLHPGAAHVVSDLMPERNRATANGMVTAGALIGIAFSFPAFGWLMDRLSWPMAFVVSGSLMIAFSLFWKRSTQTLSFRKEAPPTLFPEETDRPAEWTSLLLDHNLWLVSLSYAAYGYFQYLFFYWMDYYFKSVLHVPDVEARWASFWIMLAMGAGMAIGGMSTDVACHRLGRSRGRRAVVVFGMGMGAVFALLGVNVTGQINVAMCLAVSMASLGMCEGVFWTTATDIGGRSRGFCGAFMNALGNVGGLVSPVLTPVMAQRMGWPGAITVACLIAGVGGATWFVIQLPERQDDSVPITP
jgi:MFS transporter, ACS family, D-galactonate transporter